jgi:hypothetical protein
MATYVRYVPDGRELDLARLTPADYQLITDLHGEIHRGEPMLICLRPGIQNSEMFIRERSGRFFAAHFPGGGHGEHPISPTSKSSDRRSPPVLPKGALPGITKPGSYRCGSTTAERGHCGSRKYRPWAATACRGTWSFPGRGLSPPPA